jgi:hypothetical protein
VVNEEALDGEDAGVEGGFWGAGWWCILMEIRVNSWTGVATRIVGKGIECSRDFSD